ncbi:MAG: branched-chain-amino-acid transaminase [Proteobacteria bacterium]|nr:MAG: branched-chain-amino-acid transaminase [Pseudomonadota bacterium]
MKVWIDGAIVDAADARIPVLDHGLLYGDGVFEGIRAYGRAVFRLDDHLTRLATSARAIGLVLPKPLAEIREIVLGTLRALGRDDAYVRLVATRGVGALGVDPTTCPQAGLFCLAAEAVIYPPEKLADGLDLVTVSVRRPALDAVDPQVKSLNYLNNALAKQEAKARGADEALLLNAAGTVAEASVANVFAVSGRALATPPPTDGALAGITRRSVLEVARQQGFAPLERSLSRVDLLGADEVFLTGTGAGVVPVRSLDGQPIGAGEPGPAFARLRAAFLALTKTLGVPF